MIITNQDNIELYQNEIESIITEYCENHNIDESDIYPSVWDDILTEIYIKVYHNNIDLLHTDKNISNAYDKDKIYKAYYIYKRLCNSHCQEICIKGFITMIGISKQNIYNWRDGKGLSNGALDLHEKITEDNEQSLFNLMKDRRNNPMKYLPKLNKVHNWNMPGVRAAHDNNKSIGFDSLPELPATPLQIEPK